jgi:DNA-binding response OmpR family regulator
VSAGRDSRSRQPAILVVDDDAEARLLVQRFLASEGYQVSLADGSADALLQIGQRRFDLIICDLRMPGLNGFAFMNELAQKGVRVPVIMITAIAAPELEAKGLELGAEDYLHKPLNREVLLLRVRKVIDRHQQHPAAAG